MTPEQEQFLREHRLAVLATGRADGSPQASTVYYHFDGSQLLVSVTTDRAKWLNTVRQPRVALVVNEDRKQLVLYGRAEGLAAEPERTALHRVLRTAMGRPPEQDDAALSAELAAAKRAILRITPERVSMND